MYRTVGAVSNEGRKIEARRVSPISSVPSALDSAFDEDESSNAHTTCTSTVGRPTCNLNLNKVNLSMVEGTGAPAPTLTEYDVVTESCDWCLVDTPWDGDEEDESIMATPTHRTATTQRSCAPKTYVNPPAFSVTADGKKTTRKTLGIPML
jgi:hypothetical protein